MGDHFENSTGRVAGPVGFIHYFLHASFGFSIHAPERYGILVAESDHLIPFRRPLQTSRADGDDMAEDLDTELPQERFGQRADGYPRRRFARTRALQNVTSVRKVVFDGACQV